MDFSGSSTSLVSRRQPHDDGRQHNQPAEDLDLSTELQSMEILHSDFSFSFLGLLGPRAVSIFMVNPAPVVSCTALVFILHIKAASWKRFLLNMRRTCGVLSAFQKY